jgi:hypothetical protein
MRDLRLFGASGKAGRNLRIATAAMALITLIGLGACAFFYPLASGTAGPVAPGMDDVCRSPPAV